MIGLLLTGFVWFVFLAALLTIIALAVIDFRNLPKE